MFPRITTCILLLHVLQLMDLMMSAEVSEVTCNMPPVKAGEDATLTCNFTENLNAEKPEALVQRKALDSNKWSDVLDCYKSNGNYNCDIKDQQFHMNSTPSETIVLVLKNSTKATEGTYKCSYLPETVEERQTCTFSLQISHQTDTPTPIPEQEGQDDSTGEENQGIDAGIIAGSVIGGVVLLVIVILVILRQTRS